MTTGAGQNGTNGSHGHADGRGTHRWVDALVVGAGGASALTLTHEVVRQLLPRSPRLDRLGGTALSRLLRAVGVKPPRGETLRGLALAMDLVANAAWYAPVAGMHARPLRRGLALGLAAGIGAVVLTPMLGLPKRARGTTPGTMALTVGLYTLGGLVAAGLASFARSRRESTGGGEAG